MTAALGRFNSRTFASLRSRNYRLFFAGQAVSQTGSWMQRIALGWFVLQITHSPFAVGVMAFAQFVPFMAFGLFAGVFADRLDARRTVIGTQAAQLAQRSGAGLDRARRDRAAVDALPDRVRERVGARPRRAVAAAADVPDGRARRAPERDRPQLEPLQRVADLRAGGRGHRATASPVLASASSSTRSATSPSCSACSRCASREFFPLEQFERPVDPARDAGGARLRAAAAADAGAAVADVRAQHLLLQLQRHAAGARQRRPCTRTRRSTGSSRRSSAAARSSARSPRPRSGARRRR